MRLTKKSKYAARAAMVEIALSGRGPLGVAEISHRQSIPERFLEQIFGELRSGGIVEILDSEVRPARYSGGGGHYIDDAPPCSTSKASDEARVALEGVFNRYSIAQLAGAERGSREESESSDRQVTRGPPLLTPL